MSEYTTLATLALFVFLYSCVASRLSRTILSSAILFTLFGFLFGPGCLDILDLHIHQEALRTLAELTLAFVLFTDASKADLRVLKFSIGLPERLLFIGLPMTIALGFGVGILVFDGLGMLELAILATMLAPTDAALGKPVVTNAAVPAKVRESLNVESGLNDGICVPILFILLSLAAHTGGNESTLHLASRLILEEIGIGVATGIGLTVCASGFIHFCMTRKWLPDSYMSVPIVALALSCFAVAQTLGGSGFIASFTGGLLFGSLVKKHKDQLLEAAEGTGVAASLLTWVAFGSAIVSMAITNFDWKILLYAILSLTVIRMLPVLLCLAGTGLRLESKLFIGWFGPRGLASVVFIIIVLGQDLPGKSVLGMTVVYTILLSILLHGLSASPLAAWYGKRADGKGV